MKNESLLGVSLELIETVAIPGPYPADARVGKFFRARRFLGSRDRRCIGDLVWAWLRLAYRGRSYWRAAPEFFPEDIHSDEDLSRLEREQSLPPDEEVDEDSFAARKVQRSAVLRRSYLVDLLTLAASKQLTWDHETTVEAAGAVQIPGEDEAWTAAIAAASSGSFAEKIAGLDLAAQTFDLRASMPEWLAKRVEDQYGAEHAEALGQALLEPATIDLRVNLQKKGRDSVKEHLERDTQKTVELTPHSHLGLRLRERANLTASVASRNSWIEIQDEGSQIAVLCADIQPRMTILDACAGTGGKSLAMIDILIRYFRRVPKSREEGNVVACDIAKDKLGELERRVRDTGIGSRMRLVHIYPAGDLPEAVPMADVVFVDAPCSGLGTLRRNPELKRRNESESITEYAEQQLEILSRFASKVKDHGTLVFVTCSLLKEEGEDVAKAFEEAHPGFRPYESLWAMKNLPDGCIDGHYIRLDPVLSGTDAFFIAIWEKKRSAPTIQASAESVD